MIAFGDVILFQNHREGQCPSPTICVSIVMALRDRIFLKSLQKVHNCSTFFDIFRQHFPNGVWYNGDEIRITANRERKKPGEPSALPEMVGDLKCRKQNGK